MSDPVGFGLWSRRSLPMIQGAEAAECGLACMAMVARYWGHDLDLNGLRQRFALSMTGATLKSLVDLADALDLSPRALRIELEDLDGVQRPAILHWDMNHFVVLKSINARSAVIHDPARGVVEVRLDELSKRFTGVVLELAPATNFKPIALRQRLRLQNLWSRMSGAAPALTQVVGLSLALQLITFVLPFQIQLVVDEAVGGGDIGLLGVIAVAFAGVIALRAVVEALRSWSILVFGQIISFQMVGNVVRHMIRLPSDYFEKRHVGDILSRIGSAHSIQEILTQGFISAIIDGLMSVIALIILFFYSPKLALVVILAVLVNLLISMLVFPRMRMRQEEQIVHSAREQSYLMESVRAATTVRLLGRESQRESHWRNLYAKVINSGLSVSRYQIAMSTAQLLITGIQSVLVIYIGARMIIQADGFSIGMLIAFIAFAQTFNDRTQGLITQLIQVRFVGLHLERLGDIVLTTREPATFPTRDQTTEGQIELNKVSFRYGDADPTVINQVSLRISSGEFVALTGPSGGGKSTLVKILLGLREPSSGEVLLDGQPASPELWRAWRSSVGVVVQDDHLISGTIAENIAFFDPNLDMVRVVEAAIHARVHDEIERTPMKYMSLVGDMGSTLSGGQKQRILIARALYKKPKVLVLDEGTANLDEANEKAIADLIADMPVTRVVVAHRPALLERASRVITIAAGEILSARDQSH
ncbi:peptidase domain-containing ABC transporter [uncultured Brevundimonas sp.]|uniref:peptidase domain-containing ABC transporter n=1 Tax=uncultured Brevundimonas sp. TaxID=213418 RepID=UPI0025F3C2E4|nr:peptidase domain-containing ABC transporter [uncultured Brevundimonas sp.]